MRLIVFIPLLIVNVCSYGQNDFQKWMKEGDEFYRQQKFGQATESYSKAIQADQSNEKAKFNHANSLYKQDKKLDAVQVFAAISEKTTDVKLRSAAWYNKGVILTDQKNLEGSIEAYKHALRNDPNDRETRENLQKALLELKKKQQENKKSQQDQQKKKPEEKQSSSKMQPKEAEQRLRLLQQKEKEVQERVQKQKTKTGGSQARDW